MSRDVVRVKVRLEIDGQTTEISRCVEGKDQWAEVEDSEIVTFARELLDLSLTGHGLDPKPHNSGTAT